MKRIITLLMGIMLMLPMMAQYRGPRVVRPVPRPPQYRPSYRDAGRYPDYHSPAYFGLRAGLSVSAVHSDDAYLDGSGLSSGVTMGFVTGVQIAPHSPVYLETGLSYTEKGGHGHYDGRKFTYDLNYLEMPMIMKAAFNVDRYTSIQPFAGAYIALGVGGQVKDFGTRKATSSFDDDFFKRFDGGLRMGCGVQFSHHVYGEVAYDLGLSNICHDTFSTSHNGSLQLTCGVNF